MSLLFSSPLSRLHYICVKLKCSVITACLSETLTVNLDKNATLNSIMWCHPTSTAHSTVTQNSSMHSCTTKVRKQKKPMISCNVPLVGKKLQLKNIFVIIFFFKKISSYILFLFSSFCFKGHTPSSYFILFYFFPQEMLGWIRINWMQKGYPPIHQVKSPGWQSRSPKLGQCGCVGCWCKKGNGTPEYPNTSGWDGFLWSLYYHARDLLAYIQHCFCNTCSVVTAMKTSLERIV